MQSGNDYIAVPDVDSNKVICLKGVVASNEHPSVRYKDILYHAAGETTISQR